ncbi:MAG: hypothetical protein HRT73_14315, partial [Flavobacteriales bacterium]|nr:hypothetical protein [Flavobacteriales bacterium]
MSKKIITPMESNESIGLNIEKVKIYFHKGLRYWYVLFLFLLIGISFGFYKVRYNVPAYSVNGRILVKEEWKGYGADAFLPGMEIVSERNRLANEMGIIKSFPLMSNVIEDLPELKVSYFDIGNVRRTEMYKTSPFELYFDSIKDISIYNYIYSLRVIDNTKFVLSDNYFDDDKGTEYLFGKNFLLEGNIISIDLKKFSENILNKNFQFIINNPKFLAKYYQDATQLTIDLDEMSSILLVSLTGTNSAKEIDVVNSIMKNFIRFGIEEGNKKGVSTLKFVNEQIEVVANSLVIAESKLEAFKRGSNLKRIDYRGERIINEITELEKKKLELEFTVSFSKSTIDYIKNNDDAKGIVIPYFINRQSVLYDLMIKLINNYAKIESFKFTVKEENTAMKLLRNDISVSKSILIENLISLKNKSENDYLIATKQLEFLEHKILETPSTE